jgi:hypothetical protein
LPVRHVAGPAAIEPLPGQLIDGDHVPRVPCRVQLVLLAQRDDASVVRDREVSAPVKVQLVIDAVLTGHRVVSHLHSVS